MGRFILPTAIILYIIASIVGAVIKALTPPPQPVRSSKPKIDPEPSESAALYETIESEIPSKTPRFVPEEEFASENDYDNDDFFEQDWVAAEIQQEQQGLPLAGASQISRVKMIRLMQEGFIMSEIFREPRSQRPWPNR